MPSGCRDGRRWARRYPPYSNACPAHSRGNTGKATDGSARRRSAERRGAPAQTQLGTPGGDLTTCVRKRRRGPPAPPPRRHFCRGARHEAGPARPAFVRGKPPAHLEAARGRLCAPASAVDHTSTQVMGARSAMSWRRLSLGTRVRSLRGRPVAGSVLERIGFSWGLQCSRE